MKGYEHYYYEQQKARQRNLGLQSAMPGGLTTEAWAWGAVKPVVSPPFVSERGAYL